MAQIPRSQEIFRQDLDFTQGDLRATGTKDIGRVHGLDNLRQAVLNRLLTVPGTLPLKPAYGIGLKRWQGRLDTVTAREEIMREMLEQFSADERIDEVQSLRIVRSDSNPGQFTVEVKILAVGGSPLEVGVDV